MEERTDAGQWLYERAELDGMEVWGTGAALDHSSVPDGLYCYNLYGTGEPEDFAHNFISKEPVEKDCVGAVLSAQPLPFQGKESMCTLQQVTGEVRMAENQQQQTGFQMQGI